MSTTSSAASSVFFTQAVPGVRQVEDHRRNAALGDVDDLLEGALVEIVGAVEGGRRGEQAEVIRAAGEQAVEEVVVEAIRGVDRLGDALRRILVEVEAGGAEGEVEIGDDDVVLEVAGDRPGDVVGDHRGADAALGADEGDGAAERLGGAIDVEVGDRLDDAHQVDRRDEIFADAALGEAAVELDVVDVADDDDLGAGVADLGQAVELGVEPVARQLRLSTMIRFGVAAAW